PENLYVGANAAEIRRALLEEHQLLVLLAFRNTRDVWFRGAQVLFCLYAARSSGKTDVVPAAFDIETLGDLANAREHLIRIPVEIIREFSPDALSIMRITRPEEIGLISKAYARCPKFGNPDAGDPYRDYSAELHMGNDRDLFSDTSDGLPVYEGRMVGQ